MNHDHPLAAITTTWGLFLTSLVVKAIPFLQALSLILAITASVYAIRYYNHRTPK